ncbi:uncharacterized protein [Pithys albifrons albifrons]|uniref:uncharacterized protein n=1 Tax=Pithys albifrons albifrons TaxID=3385563 RepID=UPI003A5D05CA
MLRARGLCADTLPQEAAGRKAGGSARGGDAAPPPLPSRSHPCGADSAGSAPAELRAGSGFRFLRISAGFCIFRAGKMEKAASLRCFPWEPLRQHLLFAPHLHRNIFWGGSCFDLGINRPRENLPAPSSRIIQAGFLSPVGIHMDPTSGCVAAARGVRGLLRGKLSPLSAQEERAGIVPRRREPGSWPGRGSQDCAQEEGAGIVPRRREPGSCPGRGSRDCAQEEGAGIVPRRREPGSCPGRGSRDCAQEEGAGIVPRRREPGSCPGGESRDCAQEEGAGIVPRKKEPGLCPGAGSRDCAFPLDCWPGGAAGAAERHFLF